MIILDATTDNLQIVLGGTVTTNQLPVLTSWRDITTTAYTPGKTVVNTNNTTDVNIVPAPGASTQRVVDTIFVHNRDTANATVTIKFDANATEYILFVCTLAPGERLEYIDGQGFKVFASTGALKTSQNQGANAISSSLSSAVLSADVTNNNAVANTIADVTGLSFAVTSGNKYYFKFIIQYTAAATTTGSRWSISGPGGTMRYRSDYSLTTTTRTLNDSLTAHDTPAASNASSGATASNIAIIEGFYEASATGNVIARFASEVASSAIVAEAGSVVYYHQVQ